jgi:hypothetical protein
VTRQRVLSDLLEAIQAAREQGNPGAMIAGAREIGKLMGFYSPELVKISIGTDEARLKARYEAMSDEELMTVIDGQCKTV